MIEKDIMNSKQFSKTIKPLFLIKFYTFLEGDKTFTQDAKYALIWNTIFSNLAKNLKTPDFEEVNSFAEKIYHLILKAISNIVNTQVSNYHCY